MSDAMLKSFISSSQIFRCYDFAYTRIDEVCTERLHEKLSRGGSRAVTGSNMANPKPFQIRDDCLYFLLAVSGQMEAAEHQEYLFPESLLDRSYNPFDAGMGATGYYDKSLCSADNQRLFDRQRP